LEAVSELLNLLPATVVLLVGAFGVISVVFEGWLKATFPTIAASPMKVTSLLVSLIAMQLGAERLVLMEKLNNRTISLLEEIRRTSDLQVIPHHKLIYPTALETQKSAKKIIRLTSSVSVPRNQEEYLRQQVHIAKGKYNDGQSVEFRILVKEDSTSAAGVAMCFLKRRMEIYEAAGISKDQIRIRRTGSLSPGLDILLVDEQHLLLAFPQTEATGRFAKSLFFYEEKSVVEAVADWYDNFLWESAEEVTVEETRRIDCPEA
jgi:hypothetical protein